MATSPPPRPSRANTATLDDIFPPNNEPPATRRLSVRNFEQIPGPESLPPTPASGTTRVRSSTRSKFKKSVLGFIFNTSKRPKKINTPYDPVHLTHIDFNSSTGEFIGLPKEWEQLLQESDISKSDQEKDSQAVMEIVKFYQEGHGSIWDNFGGIVEPNRDFAEDGFQNPRSPPPPPKPKEDGPTEPSGDVWDKFDGVVEPSRLLDFAEDGFQNPRSPPEDGPTEPSGDVWDKFGGVVEPSRDFAEDGFQNPRSPPEDGFRNPRSPPEDGFRNPRSPPEDGPTEPSFPSQEDTVDVSFSTTAQGDGFDISTEATQVEVDTYALSVDMSSAAGGPGVAIGMLNHAESVGIQGTNNLNAVGGNQYNYNGVGYAVAGTASLASFAAGTLFGTTLPSSKDPPQIVYHNTTIYEYCPGSAPAENTALLLTCLHLCNLTSKLEK